MLLFCFQPKQQIDMPVSDQKNLSQMNHDPRLEAIVDRMLEKYGMSMN